MTSSPPAPSLQHYLAMCDDTGLFQHAVHSVPDRSHGYCIDDNARALLVTYARGVPDEINKDHAGLFAAFIQHAWNPETRRFRNFMSFDRRWLESVGSEDSHGRALWALGECARTDRSASRRSWSVALFREALPALDDFHSPRAWAFALLGLDRFCDAVPDDRVASRARHCLANRLLALLEAQTDPSWTWFEDVLAYDNARLPQCLIESGTATGDAGYLSAGLRTLAWLVEIQTAPEGHFRPVGSDSFGIRRRHPEPFDQQPLEAAATVAACRAAFFADGDKRWHVEANRAHDWFLGRNDLAVPLFDPLTGTCRDGLHPDRANENCGAESILSYLLSCADLSAFSA